MLKVFVEEAAALASITLFIGMIAIWAQLIPQLWRRPGQGPGRRFRPGEKRDGGPHLCLPRGLIRSQASPLSGESASTGGARSLKPG